MPDSSTDVQPFLPIYAATISRIEQEALDAGSLAEAIVEDGPYLKITGGIMGGPVALYQGSTAPTLSPTDSSTNIATTQFVSDRLAPVVYGAPFLPISGGEMLGELYYRATGGTALRSAQDRLTDVANVMEQDADPSALMDSTVSFQNALLTGKTVWAPVGRYRLTRQLSLAGASQVIRGDGRDTVLVIDTRFDPTANGVISMEGALFPAVENLTIEFVQADDLVTTAVLASATGTNTITVASNTGILVGMSVVDRTARPGAIPSTVYFTAKDATTITAINGNELTLSANITDPGVAIGDSLQFAATRSMFKTLAEGPTGAPGEGVKYPWAIYAGPGSNDVSIRNVFINDSWNGVYIRGSAFHVANLDVNAYNVGLDIDQCYNFPSISDYRFYMFGGLVTGGPTDARDQVYNDGVPIAANLGETDGLGAHNIQTWRGHVNLTSNWSWGSFTNLMLDGDNTNLTITGNSGGVTQIVGGYSTNGPNTHGHPISIDSAGEFIFTNFNLINTSNSASGILMTRGKATISDAYMWYGMQTSLPMIEVYNDAFLELRDTKLDASGSRPDVYINTSGNNNVSMDNVRFTTPGGPGAVGLNGGAVGLNNVTWNGWKANVGYNKTNNGNSIAGSLDETSIQAGSFSFHNLSATQHFNTGYGYLSLDSVQDGATGNAAFGALAGFGISTGKGNSFFGETSGYNGPITGDGNVGLGNATAYNLTSGDNNLLLGAYADQAVLRTGSGNIIVGPNLGIAAPDTSYTLNLGGIMLTTGIDAPASAISELRGTFWFPGNLNYTATGGFNIRAAQDRAADELNVLDFYGSKFTTELDISDALLRALSTGKNVWMPGGYRYRIHKQIGVGINGNTPQRLRGDGKSTCLLVEGNFDQAADSIIKLYGAEGNGPTLCDLWLLCAQSTTANKRSEFVNLGGPGGGTTYGIKYPPAILFDEGCNRFRIERVRISNAWDGIHQVEGSSSGGWWIRDIEISAFNIGLKVGKTKDFCHVHGWHNWWYDQTSANIEVMSDGQVYCMQFGQGGETEGLNMSEVNNFVGRILIENSAGWLQMSNIMMDADNSVFEHNAQAWTQVSNIYFTCSEAGPSSGKATVDIQGGNLEITNLHGWNGSQPFISQTDGSLTIIGGQMLTVNQDVPLVRQTGGWFHASHLKLQAVTSAAWTVPLMHCSGGTFILTDSSFAANTVGDVGAIQIDVDDVNHQVTNVQLNGWHFTPPGPLGNYQINGDFFTKTVHAGEFVAGSATAGGADFVLHATGQKTFNFYNNNRIHWAFGVFAPNDDWGLLRFDDAGVQQPNTWWVDRATGLIQSSRAGTVTTWDVSPSDMPAPIGWRAIGIQGVTNITPVIDMINTSDNTTVALAMRRSRGSPTAPTAVKNGDILGDVLFSGYNGTAWSGTSASIRAQAGADWGANEYNSYLVFSTFAGTTGIDAFALGNSGANFQVPVSAPSLTATTIRALPSDTQAQLAIYPPNTANGLESKIRFGATFPTGGDLAPRYVASMRSGFSVTDWLAGYVDLYISNQTNDANSDANQGRIARFTNSGIILDKPITGPLYYTATGGTVARSAQDRAADEINVKDQGVKGDGSADDTAAIRATITRGGDIYFPPGIYMVSGDVIVVPNNTRLRGAGSALTIIRSGTMNVRTWDNQPDDDDLPKRPPGAGQRLWNVPTVFCNALYLSPGPFAAPSTTPALQTDHDISIEGIGFDSARVSEPATLRFLLARRLKFNDLRFFNSGAGAWGGGGIGLIGCDEVGIRDCDIPASTNPIDCWQGCTRVKISDCVLGAYDHGAVVNGGLINWNGGGTVTSQTQSSNDLQVSDCTFWLRNTMAMFLDSMSSGCSSHTHVISGCRIHAAVGTANNLGIVGRGLGGNTKIHDCTFSAAPGQTISAPILFSGFYGAVGQYVAGGIVSTTAGSPNFTVSVPNGTDVGPGNYCMIDNNAGGPVVGNGMSLNGWYLVLSVSGTTSDSSTGTLLTCRGPNNATATGVIAGTTRQQGYLGTFKGCQITDITFDGVGYAGNYLIDLGGGGHRVDGVTVTQNYYGGSPQYLAIVQFDSTQDFGNPNIPRVQIDNIIGAAGIGSLPGGWAGDNRITWQPYSTQPDLPVWNLNGNGGLLVGGFVWGQAGPLPTPPANGLLVMGPVQLAAVATGASYATDAAAAAGGVELHTAYRNGSALMVRVT